MRFLIDENLPRSLAKQVGTLGFEVQDVRDIGLQGRPDDEVMEAAIATDAIIVTRDRGFVKADEWPKAFSAGVVFVNLPDTATATQVNEKVMSLLAHRLPVSLLGAVTIVETNRALSRIVRRRPKMRDASMDAENP